jgi:hypothetical protein
MNTAPAAKKLFFPRLVGGLFCAKLANTIIALAFTTNYARIGWHFDPKVPQMTVSLPAGFEYLEPFAKTWGDLRSQGERYLKRQSLPYEDLAAFHAALAPRLEEVFQYLDRFPMDALPEPEARLFRTVLGMTEASQAVEVFGQARVPNTPFPHAVEQEWVGYVPR